MPGHEVDKTSLRHGLEAHQWNTVLSFGRRARINGQCWLETYSQREETFAMVLEGCIGIRPVPTDTDEKWDAKLCHSPAVIRFATDPDPDLYYCHWIADRAEVYFYTLSALHKAIASVPSFACNFIEILCCQHEKLCLSYDGEFKTGAKRLCNSLLARAGTRQISPVVVSVTQADLAFDTGLSRQWVNRLLREMEKNGTAKLGRGQVILPSPAALKEIL